MVDWAVYVTAGSTLGLFMVAAATLWVALRRFQRETLSIDVTATQGGIGGEAYDEVGFRVCLVNRGTQDVVVYSAGYHVKDDLDDRSFEFPDEYIYYRPAEEGDEGAFPRSGLQSSAYESYRPDSPFLTIHSEYLFPIRIPPGGIYGGLWPVTIVRHRSHLAALENQRFSDKAGLYEVIDNPIPFIFFSTIHGTKKVKLRPFGRWPRLLRLLRLTAYRLSRVPGLGRLEQLIISPGSVSGFGYWADKQIGLEKQRRRYFFPPSSFNRGIHPMSVEENRHQRSVPDSYGLSSFHQMVNQIDQITNDGEHLETANYTFKVTTSHSYRYGLLSATVERPEEYSTYKAHSFLELEMLLGLDKSWAHPVVDTVRRTGVDGGPEIYDTRHYLIPHQLD